MVKKDKEKEQDKAAQKSWAEAIESESDVQPEQEKETEKTTEQAETGEQDKLEHPSYEELEAKLTETEQKLEDYWNQMLRAQSELNNIRKRTEKDVANARKYALEPFVRELITVIDSLESAVQQVPEDQEKTLEGLQLTLEKFLKIMGDFGVEQLNPEGEPFNPEYHEAMSTQEAGGEVKPNQVVQVLQKGYLLNQRLVRPALVIVAKSTES